MTKNEKRLLKNGIIIPAVTALIFAALFIAFAFSAGAASEKAAPAQNKSQSAEIKEITSFDGSANDDKIKKSQLGEISSNTKIGQITVGDELYELINDASASNAVGRYNIKTLGVLPGEVGVCFAEVYKDGNSKLRLLAKGDTVTIDTFYSMYEYEITDTFEAETKRELLNSGAGKGRALVLYTDSSVGAGIGDGYYVCVCKMKSGTKVEE